MPRSAPVSARGGRQRPNLGTTRGDGLLSYRRLMTWALLHDRMAFMAEVIEAAETDPEAALELSGKASEVTRLFGDEVGLLLSLRQRWMMALVAKLDQAEHEGLPAAQARAELEAAQPGLHALVQIGARRSSRVRLVSRSEHTAMQLFGAPAGERQTVA